jgi:hypothetical protein
MPPSPQDVDLFRRKDELRKWWDEISGEEADLAVAKADEYGSYDLLLLGRVIADMTDYPVAKMVAEGQSEDEIHTELGIAFYVQGKLARWVGAIKEGRRVSDDTLADTVVYVRMVQRARAVGGWPWGDGPNYSGGAPREPRGTMMPIVELSEGTRDE